MTQPNVIEPLEGEAVIPGVTTERPQRTNIRQMVAVAVLALSVVGVLGYTAVRHFAHGATTDTTDKTVAPDVASGRVGKLDMTPPPNRAASSAPLPAASAAGVRVGEIDPDATPIPLRGAGAIGSPTQKVTSPEDAPIFAAGATPDLHGTAQRATGTPDAKTTSALENYQKQVGPLVQQLQRLASGETGAASTLAAASMNGAAPNATVPAAPLFGTLERSATPTVQARLLGDRSLLVAKGTLFTCSLKTRVITATSGLVGCQVMRNVFSDDGRVLLIERGSHLDGEYRIVQVRPGLTRIPVLWTRVRTPTGAVVDLDSPATGPLGESGIGGYVDNRWGERIGGALLLSLVDDAVQLAASRGSSDNSGSNNTLVLPNTTAQGSKLAEKVLEATINIPPLLYQNQGGVVGVYVARDIDFSTVYELQPGPAPAPTPNSSPTQLSQTP